VGSVEKVKPRDTKYGYTRVLSFRVTEVVGPSINIIPGLSASMAVIINF
jgi:hypothetical protein